PRGPHRHPEYPGWCVGSGANRTACAGLRTSISDDHQSIGPRLRAPDFARPAEQLPHRSTASVARKTLERLGHRVETQDRIGEKIRDPDFVFVVDIDGVTAALAFRQAPDFPRLVHGVIAGEFS